MSERPILPESVSSVVHGTDEQRPGSHSTANDELLSDPKDFTAVGGPDTEPAYGRSRALDGEYPFNEQGGTYDLDEPSHVERGGIQTHHQAPRPTTR